MDKQEALRRYLDWIDADRDGLESMGGEPDLTDLHFGVESIPDQQLEQARTALRSLSRPGEDIPEEYESSLEAIVLPGKRPVIDVLDGSFDIAPGRFGYFSEGEVKTRLESAIASVGRVEVPDHPQVPYAGTGFVVADDLVMTNRHVAGLFARGLGRNELSFIPGQQADVDFKRERDRDEAAMLDVSEVVMIHPYWDMALLRVSGISDSYQPLTLSTTHPADLEGRDVAVIGYPALDPRNEVELQRKIFDGVFNVKRIQPGRLREVRRQISFGNMVEAVTHDCSTLGGNSGSCVVDVTTGEVVALHFAGRYLEANFAVPTFELARDGYVVDTGVNFAAGTPGNSALYSPWEDDWVAADPSLRRPETVASSVSGAASGAGESVTVVVPVEVTVRVSPEAAVGSVAGLTLGAAPTAGLEAMVEPFHDEHLETRSGYDDGFLGQRLDLPTVVDLSRAAPLVGTTDDTELRYEHFSVIMDRHRRLAMMTACNVDARPDRKQPEPGRDYTRRGLSGLREHDRERWFTDPRILPEHQLPDRFFTKDRQLFDKGHLVRRVDVAWGDEYDEVRRANGDTYHVTNCSPQVKGFNRVNLGGSWGQLENLVLSAAEVELLSVFAGPVLAADDPIFVGVDEDSEVRVQIPRRFWKVAVAQGCDGLESFGFLLDQDLSATDLEMTVPVEWRSRMVSVPRLAEVVGILEFPEVLVKGDQIATEHGETVRSSAGGLEMMS